MDELRLSTTAEAPMQASKWLTCQVLLDTTEMQELFSFLGTFFLFYSGTVTLRGQELLPQELFLDHYRQYVDALKGGQIPPLSEYQSRFSPAMTATKTALFAIPIDAERRLVRVAMPVIQLQAHHVDYSPLDQKFRSMVLGSHSIPWGIQFSYPQLYQDAATKQVEQVRKIPDFPNNALFHNLQKWMRQYTTPTRFSVDNVECNVPIRLGKQCTSWINRHAQLKHKGIQVVI